VAVALAAALHGAILLWLAPRLRSAGTGSGAAPGAGVALTLVAAAPAPRPRALKAAPVETPKAAERTRATAPPELPIHPVPPVSEPLVSEPLVEAAVVPAHEATPEPPSPEPAEATPGAPRPEPLAADPSARGGSGSGEAGAGGDAARRYVDRLSVQVQGCLRYPQRALRRRIGGEVGMALEIAADGALEDARLVSESGSALLDRDALDTVRRCAPYPPPPAAGRYDIVLGYDLLDR
jgi:protein TonB